MGKLESFAAALSGGVEGYLESKKQVREQEESKLKQKLIEKQIEKFDEELMEGGLKRQREKEYQTAVEEAAAKEPDLTELERKFLKYAPAKEGLEFFEKKRARPQTVEQQLGEHQRLKQGGLIPEGYQAEFGKQLEIKPPKETKVTTGDILVGGAQKAHPGDVGAQAEFLRTQKQVLVPQAQQQRVEIAGATGTAGALGREKVASLGRQGKLGSSVVVVRNLESMAKNLFTATSTSSANMQGAQMKLRRMASEPKLKQYDDVADSFVGTLRQLAAEPGGVLSNQDVERIRKALASDFDTQDTVEFKFRLITQIMNTVLEGERALTSSGDFSQARANIDALLKKLEISGGAQRATGKQGRLEPIQPGSIR